MSRALIDVAMTNYRTHEGFKAFLLLQALICLRTLLDINNVSAPMVHDSLAWSPGHDDRRLVLSLTKRGKVLPLALNQVKRYLGRYQDEVRKMCKISRFCSI